MLCFIECVREYHNIRYSSTLVIKYLETALMGLAAAGPLPPLAICRELQVSIVVLVNAYKYCTLPIPGQQMIVKILVVHSDAAPSGD